MVGASWAVSVIARTGEGEILMVHLGYTLSSEEFRPNDLVANARRAEETGFTFATISDHYHPWVDTQEHSPFVWSTRSGRIPGSPAS